MDSRKRNFIIAFAAIVVIGVGTFAIWSPNFPSKDASGAIGAVEKHRDTQITAKDVVLADESTARAAKVLFGDHLNDATAIQKIGAELGAAVNNKESLGVARGLIESHQADLQARFYASMSAALGSMQSVLNGNKEQLGAMKFEAMSADLQAMQQALGRQSSFAQMEQLNAQFQGAVARLEASGLGAATKFAAADTLDAAARLGSADSLDAAARLGKADSLEAAARLGSADSLEAARNLGKADTLEAAARLGSAESLASFFRAAEVLQAESALEAARNLGKQSSLNNESVLEAARNLGAAAATLDSAARNFGNREALGSSLAAQATSLGAMALQAKSLDAAASFLGRAAAYDNKQQFESHALQAVSSLGVAAGRLEAMAVANMEAMFGAQQRLGSMIANMESALGSAKLESSSLGSEALQAFNASLASFDKSLANLDQSFESHTVGSMQAQLGAVSAHLEAVSQLAGRTNLGRQADLQAASSLGKQAALGNESGLGKQAALGNESALGRQAALGSTALFNADALAAMSNHLGAMNQALESSGLGIRLANRDQLANQAEALQNRAADLGGFSRN